MVCKGDVESLCNKLVKIRDTQNEQNKKNLSKMKESEEKLIKKLEVSTEELLKVKKESVSLEEQLKKEKSSLELISRKCVRLEKEIESHREVNKILLTTSTTNSNTTDDCCETEQLVSSESVAVETDTTVSQLKKDNKVLKMRISTLENIIRDRTNENKELNTVLDATKNLVTRERQLNDALVKWGIRNPSIRNGTPSKKLFHKLSPLLEADENEDDGVIEILSPSPDERKVDDIEGQNGENNLQGFQQPSKSVGESHKEKGVENPHENRQLNHNQKEQQQKQQQKQQKQQKLPSQHQQPNHNRKEQQKQLQQKQQQRQQIQHQQKQQQQPEQQQQQQRNQQQQHTRLGHHKHPRQERPPSKQKHSTTCKTTHLTNKTNGLTNGTNQVKNITPKSSKSEIDGNNHSVSNSEKSHQKQSTDSSNKWCYYELYEKGSCKYGIKCNFCHDVPTNGKQIMKKWFNQQKKNLQLCNKDLLKWSTQLSSNLEGSESAVHHFLVNVMKEMISKEIDRQRLCQ